MTSIVRFLGSEIVNGDYLALSTALMKKMNKRRGALTVL